MKLSAINFLGIDGHLTNNNSNKKMVNKLTRVVVFFFFGQHEFVFINLLMRLDMFQQIRWGGEGELQVFEEIETIDWFYFP